MELRPRPCEKVDGPRSFVVDDRIIAIIDDDALVRDSVNRLVRSMGYYAETFSSNEELLAANSLQDICCIISDVNSADGTASRIQDLLASIGYDIPIIFMTGRLNPTVKIMLMAAGAVHVLAKPFNQNNLAFHITAALQRQYRNTVAPTSPPPGTWARAVAAVV